MKKNIAIIFSIFVTAVLIISCGKSENQTVQQRNEGNNTAGTNNETVTTANYKIEFVELGSVNCIPCKKMQPIMASIEKKYAGQVKVTFYDVWKDPAPGQKFGIQLIPTQVFLDDKGVELMRHEGFFPEEEIDKFLQSKGLVIGG
jgi:thioredoxin 1